MATSPECPFSAFFSFATSRAWPMWSESTSQTATQLEKAMALRPTLPQRLPVPMQPRIGRSLGLANPKAREDSLVNQ